MTNTTAHITRFGPDADDAATRKAALIAGIAYIATFVFSIR